MKVLMVSNIEPTFSVINPAFYIIFGLIIIGFAYILWLDSLRKKDKNKRKDNV